jgi:ATP-binding cassette subfamily B protein
LEDLANRDGLAAEQVLVPADHLAIPESRSLPAIAVVVLPSGFTHFVLIWSCRLGWVQVMDPASGRRLIREKELSRQLYLHDAVFPVATWLEWANGDEFAGPLAHRLRGIGMSRAAAFATVRTALSTSDWRTIGRLDAATRMVTTFVENRSLRRGARSRRLLEDLAYPRTGNEPGIPIPDCFWTVFYEGDDESGTPSVRVRGAVVVRLRVDFNEFTPSAQAETPPADTKTPAELFLSQPGKPLGHWLTESYKLHGQGAGSALVVTTAVSLIVCCLATIEGLILRGTLDIARDLGLVEQRILSVAFAIGLLLTILFGEWLIAGELLALGRRLELRFRSRLLEKIPRIEPRYFGSRPISDMADRAHKVHYLRILPMLCGRAARNILAIATTSLAIALCVPDYWLLAVTTAIVAIAVPLIFRLPLRELDLRVRTHQGALARFYLDSLLGLSAIRAHRAETAITREHEGLLTEWVSSSQKQLRWSVLAEVIQSIVGITMACLLVIGLASGPLQAGGVLLIAYWALQILSLGDGLTQVFNQLPLMRSQTIRLLEPLGAIESDAATTVGTSPGKADTRADELGEQVGAVQPFSRGEDHGITIRFSGVEVRAGGHIVLDGIDLAIASGEHVAVVGPSGSGKSTFLGTLLGLHVPSLGNINLNGRRFDPDQFERFRESVAWIDPEITLWNDTLLANLCYGCRDGFSQEFAQMLDATGLIGIMARLPEGLQSRLGEGGKVISGGEGQRVRIGRAWMRQPTRLAILDEPFRGLDRTTRRRLLEASREHFRNATLLCATHDLSETLHFDRVLVIEEGRIIEDNVPSLLAKNPESRFSKLLAAERSLSDEIWGANFWQRKRLVEGQFLKSEPSS